MTAQFPELQPATRAFLARQLGHFINGKIVVPAGAAQSSVMDPGRGSQLTQIPTGTSADVDSAVSAARAAFTKGAWRDMKPNMRSRVMWKFADLIEQHTQVLSELESHKAGLPIGVAQHRHLRTSFEQ